MNLLSAFLAFCSLEFCLANHDDPSSISGEDPYRFLGDDILVGIETEVEDSLVKVNTCCS